MFWGWSIVHKLVMIIIMQKRFWIVWDHSAKLMKALSKPDVHEGNSDWAKTTHAKSMKRVTRGRNRLDVLLGEGKRNETKRNPPPAPFKTEPVLLTIFFSPRINALHKCIDG